jgi:biotin operon repressor
MQDSAGQDDAAASADPGQPARGDSLAQDLPGTPEPPGTADGALVLARIRAAGTTPATVPADVLAAASSAASLVDRQLVEVTAAGGTERVLSLGWADGAAPDPDHHPSAPPRRLPAVPLLVWAACLAAAWPRAEDEPYPGQPFLLEDVLRACISMGAHDRAVIAALRLLPATGLIKNAGPVGRLGPAAAALPADTWSALRRAHDRLPHAALRRDPSVPAEPDSPDGAAAAPGPAARRIPHPPAIPVSASETLVRAMVTALETAQGPVARADLPALADPALRRATQSALVGCGRTLIQTPEGSWTTGYPAPVAQALAAEQTGTLRREQRAVLALILLRAVAIPRAQGRLGGAWTSSGHPVTLEEIAANRQLPRAVIDEAIRGLRAAGYVASAPSGGYVLGPAMARLSPAGTEALWEDLIVLARPNGYMAERIRSRRSAERQEADGTLPPQRDCEDQK